MKELEEYFDARERFCGIMDFDESTPIEDLREVKFCMYEQIGVTWVFDSQAYSSDIIFKQCKKKDSLVFALFESDFGDGSYWAVFDSQNQLSEEEFNELLESINEK